VNEPIYQLLLEGSRRIGTFGHGFTYSGHPVAAAVALETLRIYESDRILDHVAEVAPHFQRRLRALADRPYVGEVRGIGLLGGVELVANKACKRAFDPKHAVGAVCASAAEAQSLIVRPIGDTIALSPPLIVSRAETECLFDRLERALDSNERIINERGLDQ
jgi:4-aminobutyrate--pyruvate transaminase